MKLRAVQMGFVNGARVRAGGEFSLPDGAKVPSWAVAIDESKPEDVAPPARKRMDDKVVRTLSELTKKNHPTS